MAETKIYNLDYLKSHSPNNPKFVSEMIQMFLEHTPPYLAKMKNCLISSDWAGLQGNIHKIRPSIDLMGMPKDIGVTAKQMEEYCKEQIHLELVPEMFLKLEKVLEGAFKELAEELK